jgi:hypothetical protein
LIDSLRGPGTFDEYAQFDPNNEDRISLLWTPAEVANIFKKMRTEYQKAMDKFTMGTGGGTGAPEGFSVWEERHAGYVVNYDVQPCNIYLSLVYMWDKEYSFCFVDKKDPLPPDCAIGDGWTGGNNNNEDDDNRNESGFDDRCTNNTPKLKQRANKTTSSMKKSESNVVKMMEQLVSARKESQNSAGELVTLMRESKSTSNNSSESIVEQIDKATAQDKYSKKVDELRMTKNEIRSGSGSPETKKRKVKSLVDEINNHKTMVKTLSLEISQKREKLHEMLGKKDIDVSSESGMDDSE